MRSYLLGLGACLVAIGCSSDPEPETDSTPEEVLAGSCVYVNPFSQTEECKRYVGSGWTAETAATDCEVAIFGAPGTFSDADACAYPEFLGTCIVGDGTDFESELVFPGADKESCADTKQGCEVFAQGVFAPGPVCDGVVVGGGGGNVFVQPYLTCQDPLEGEPVGQSENGQVCTWTLISASTEENRRYDDYASCEDVFTQRPYYAAPPAGTTAPDDARLDDTAYMAEVAWAKKQVEASACLCCHSNVLAPDGPSQWFVESEGIWLDSISDPGIAMLAGLVDSTAFGAFDPAENNGFDRNVLGMPTTDNDRMRTLLEGEWSRRGFTLADAESIPAFGGPLAAQLDYVPQPCEEGQGMDAEGRLQWTGGDARYLYVLEPNAANPGVPPNLDEPEGTLWFVDVPTEGTPFASGVPFGEIEGDMRQRVPAASQLASGSTQYLYVLTDMGLPISRCLFVVP